MVVLVLRQIGWEVDANFLEQSEGDEQKKQSIWLVERVPRIFQTNHRAIKSKTTAIHFAFAIQIAFETQMLYGVNCSVWFKSCRQHVRLTWWIPTSLDIKSIIISFTSNLSVDDSSCLNSLSLKPVGYITCSSSFVWQQIPFSNSMANPEETFIHKDGQTPFPLLFNFVYLFFIYLFF